jgi:hypothetical protein
VFVLVGHLTPSQLLEYKAKSDGKQVTLITLSVVRFSQGQKLTAQEVKIKHS